jgi:cold-inducible RNA-binding protein
VRAETCNQFKGNMPVRLFVGNLPYNATEAELREHFSAVGPISYLSLPTDRETGQPRGFAFVEFNDRAQADDAIRRFNNQLFKGRPIAVNEARAREDRSPSGGASARPSAPRSDTPRLNVNAQSDAVNPQASGSRRSRDFGPDATPQNQRKKGRGGSRQERAPKGPMREMVRGQFFGEGDDGDDGVDDMNDFYQDTDDLYEKESNEENFAHHLSDVKSEGNN